MALRSLNSVAPERKKSMKKSRMVAFAGAPGANDENVDLHWSPNRLLAPPLATCAIAAPPSCKPSLSPACSGTPAPLASAAPPAEDACAEIEYVLSENLPDLADVDGHLSTMLERLDSKDWLKVCEAINNMRQFSIYHTSSLLPLLEKAVPLLIKALKNPRSALCKTAIMAAADLFRAYPDFILTMLEQLLLQLLLKASQDKRFVCEEAERSLEVMTAWLSPAQLLVLLQPYVTHRNPRVRAKAASCVYRSVSKLGSEGIKVYGFQPLLQIAASQLNDQLPEARESARKLVAEVYAAYPGPTLSEEPSQFSSAQQDWHQFCSTQLSLHVAQAILRLTSGP